MQYMLKINNNHITPIYTIKYVMGVVLCSGETLYLF